MLSQDAYRLRVCNSVVYCISFRGCLLNTPATATCYFASLAVQILPFELKIQAPASYLTSAAQSPGYTLFTLSSNFRDRAFCVMT